MYHCVRVSSGLGGIGMCLVMVERVVWGFVVCTSGERYASEEM